MERKNEMSIVTLNYSACFEMKKTNGLEILRDIKLVIILNHQAGRKIFD